VKTKLTVLGLLALAGIASAQVVHVWLPDTMPAHGGDTIVVPVLISDHVGKGIVAVDLTLGLDSVRLALPDSWVTQGDAVPSGWFVYATPFNCSLLVAMAGIDPLKTGDTLLKFRVLVDTVSGVAPIEIQRCQLNEGQMPCSTSNGVIGAAELKTAGRRDRVGLYPNPTRFSLCLEGTTQVEFISASGRKVAFLKQGYNDVSALPRGIYFVRRTDDSWLESKVVLIK
jgi:hypothetical protein